MYFLASFHYKIFGKRLFGKRDIPCNRMPAVINAITIIEYVSQIDKCKLQVQKPILNFILHTKICNICNIYCSISMRYFLHITLWPLMFTVGISRVRTQGIVKNFSAHLATRTKNCFYKQQNNNIVDLEFLSFPTTCIYRHSRTPDASLKLTCGSFRGSSLCCNKFANISFPLSLQCLKLVTRLKYLCGEILMYS